MRSCATKVPPQGTKRKRRPRTRHLDGIFAQRAYPAVRSLRAFMQGLEGKNKPGEERSKFQPLSNTEGVEFEVKGRDEALHRVYEAFVDRYVKRGLVAPGAAARDKRNNPIVALQASPGGGKSFFLDLVAELNEKDIQKLCKPQDSDAEQLPVSAWETVADYLRNMQPVTVTYNGASSLHAEADAQTPDQGLAMRILWSYSTREMSWGTFVSQYMENFSTLPSSNAVISSILEDCGQRGILLCVDELVKSGKPTAVASVIGGLLSDFRPDEFCAVISTLDVGPVKVLKTDSGRPVSWIPLRPLEYHDALDLFAPFLSDPEMSPEQRREIRLCISDCAGHGRSLQYLYRELRKHRHLILAPKASVIMSHVFHLLFESSFGEQWSFELVRVALAGKPVRLDHLIKGRSISEYISTGTLINQLVSTTTHFNESAEVIPKLSPMLLRFFISKAGASSNSDERTAALCLAHMLADETNFSSHQFECFHAWWEMLYRTIRVRKDETLAEFYRFEGPPDPAAPVLRFGQKKAVVVLKGEFPGDGTLRCAGGRSASVEDAVVMPGKRNNRAIDSAVVEKTIVGRNVAINHNTKYSPGSQTYLGATTIEKHFKDTIAAYEEYLQDANVVAQHSFDPPPDQITDPKTKGKPKKKGKYPKETKLGKLQLRKEDIHLVICSWQNLKLDVPTRNEADRLLVLDRSRLQMLYSPSLASRPQFLEKEEEQEEADK